MRPFQLEDLGGCFRMDSRANSGLFGSSWDPFEQQIENGVYMDEYSNHPIARFDGQAEELLAAADPDLDQIWDEERREQKARQDAMKRELSAWDAQEEADFDRADEMEESDELGFSINGRYFATPEELNEFIGISDVLCWPSDTWYPDEMKEQDSNESFPQPIKPKQQVVTRAEERHRAKRNGGRKPLGRNNCRVHLRKADKISQKILRKLEEENSRLSPLDEFLAEELS